MSAGFTTLKAGDKVQIITSDKFYGTVGELIAPCGERWFVVTDHGRNKLLLERHHFRKVAS